MKSHHTTPGEVQKDLTQLLQQAYASFQSGKYPEAESLYREVLSKYPTNPAALLMLGMVFITLNRMGEARTLLADACKVAPENPDYIRQLATGLIRVGLHGDAINYWETLTRLEPENERAYTNLGAALCMNGNLREATNAFNQALTIKPDCIEALLNQGIAYNKLGNTAMAESSFRKVLGLMPRHEMASAQLGGLLQLEGRVVEAVDIYNEALENTQESADVLFGLYGATFESEGAGKAIEILEKAVTNKPGHFLARTHLGMLLDHLGRREDAEKHFDFVRTYTPEYAFNIDSWYYAREHIGPLTRLFTLSNSGLAYSVENSEINGLLLEFGVWQGRSINFISSCTDHTVHGFDSFEGIPEAWEGMPGGSYSTFGKLPDVNANVVLHRGWFSDSLPVFLESNQGPVAFMNIDCDIYDSTKTIFDHLGEQIKPGTVIVFDEYFCFPNWREHEYRAFQEYLLDSGYQYEYLFFNLYTRQAGVIIRR
jgi:Flp pilus assembly protein TadD